MSAPTDVVFDYASVADVELVGAFLGLALADSDRDGGLPWAMTTPQARVKMRLAFTEIAERWFPDGLLEQAADWMVGEEVAS